MINQSFLRSEFMGDEIGERLQCEKIWKGGME